MKRKSVEENIRISVDMAFVIEYEKVCLAQVCVLHPIFFQRFSTPAALSLSISRLVTFWGGDRGGHVVTTGLEKKTDEIDFNFRVCGDRDSPTQKGRKCQVRSICHA